MKRKMISGLLAFMMLGNLVCANAVEPRASLYLDSYACILDQKEDSLEMVVTAIVYGTKVMDTIGASKIVVEEWTGRKWIETMTFTPDKNPELYFYNKDVYMGGVSFIGVPGATYRATMTAYAARNGGSDSREHPSQEVTCVLH